MSDSLERLVGPTQAALRDADPGFARAVIEFVVTDCLAEHARQLHAVRDLLADDWFERRIREGGVLDAAALVAGVAEAFYNAGRPASAIAECLAFLETLARVLGQQARADVAQAERELDDRVRRATHACRWHPRRTREERSP